MLICLAAPGVLALVIALGFGAMGAWLLLPFAGLETLCLLGAVLLYARRADDGDHVWLQDGQLRVRSVAGGKVQWHEFPAAWVQLSCNAATGQLIELRSGGRRLLLGRYLAPHRRAALARDMADRIRGTLQAAA